MSQKQDSKKAIESMLKKGSPAKLLMGAGSGWVAGMITTRMGKLPTALLGTSIIMFQVAQMQDFTKKSWSEVGEQAKEQKHVQEAKSFLQENPAFTAGFAGGFLIGLTC